MLHPIVPKVCCKVLERQLLLSSAQIGVQVMSATAATTIALPQQCGLAAVYIRFW